MERNFVPQFYLPVIADPLQRPGSNVQCQRNRNTTHRPLYSRLSALVIFFLATLVLAGCAPTRTNSIAIARVPSAIDTSSRAVSTSGPAQSTGGAWVGVYESYPHLIKMDLSLPQSGNAGYSIDVTMHVEPLLQYRGISAGGTIMGTVQVKVVYDPALHTLSITPEPNTYRQLGIQIPAMTGVVDQKNQLVGGTLVGARGDTSPYFILGRAEGANRQFLQALIAAATPIGATSVTSALAQKFGLGGGASIDRMLEWSSRVNTEYPDMDPWHTAIASIYPRVRNLFRDEYFKPYFGKSFDDMSSSELRSIAIQLQSRPLPQNHSPQLKPAATLYVMQNAFMPPPAGFKIQDFRLSAIAMRAMTAWRTQSAARMAASPPTTDSWKAIAGVEGIEKAQFLNFFPSERQSFGTTLASSRQHLAAPLATSLVNDLLQTSNSYSDLKRLGDAIVDMKNYVAGNPSNPTLATLSPLVPMDMRQALIARLADRQMALATAEVQTEVANAHGVDGLHQTEATLANLRQQFSRTGTANDTQQPLLASLQKKISAIDAEQAAAESAAHRIFEAQAMGLPAMIEAKSREASFAKTYGAQLDAPEFAQFNQERRAFRERLIEQNTGAFDNAIHTVDTMSKVKALTREYLVDADLNSAPAQRWMLLVQQRRTQLLKGMRTDGLYYADDIESIFTGDFDAVKIKNNGLEMSSLINSHMHSFWRRCPKSLPRNAVELTEQVCTAKWVNGYGFETGCAHWEAVGTGVFADPDVSSAHDHISASMVAEAFSDWKGTLTKLTQFLKEANNDPIGAPMKAVGSALAVEQRSSEDMDRFLALNGCATPATKQFQANFIRFGEGLPAVGSTGN